MLRRLVTLIVAGATVLGGPVVAEEIEDPTGSVCLDAEGNASCTAVAVSGTGNASGIVAASGTGDTRGAAAVSATGNAYGIVAASGTQYAVGFFAAASGTGHAVGLAAASGTGDADAFAAAASGTGNASADLVAATGTGTATGSPAVSGTGNATGGVPVSVAGGCRTSKQAPYQPCFGAGTGDVEGFYAAASTMGNATCRTADCAALSGTGTAGGELLAASGTGDATADNLAASGTGDARADNLAATATGDARAHSRAASGTGNATGDQAASGTGNATGSTAVSGTGNATGTVALDGATPRHAVESSSTVHRDEGPTASTGWPPIEAAAVRPGVRVLDGICTANFVFSDPSNQTLYVGTAGHCLDDESLGANVSLAGGEAWGFVAYNGLDTVEGVEEGLCASERGQDFGLIEIPSSVRDEVHPAALFWGGPTESRPAARSGEELYTYGNSSTRRHEALRPAKGLAVGNDVCTTETLLPERIGGDSGSPVLGADGEALGVHVRSFPVGPAEFVNVHQAVRFAENHTSLELELKTWPGFQEAPLPVEPVTLDATADPPTLPGS